LKIFPNPASEELVTIENPFFNSSSDAFLKLYAQKGQLLKTQKVDNQQQTIVLNISDLIKTACQVVLESDEIRYSEFLIIH